MISSMDLNASPPLPEEEENYEPFDDETPVEEHIETAVETLRREREERRRRLKREHQDEIPSRVVRPNLNDSVVPAWNSRSYGRKKEPPQGWLDCPSFGQCIDLIIPSKVPLDESFNDSVPPGRRYSSKQVIHQQKRAGREVGFVVDLTNTCRYYSYSEWTNQGIKYSKIACKGRDDVPDCEAINRFFHEVMQFISRQKQMKKFVLVHCTHGHNRTGFMIVNYLMRSRPMMTVTEAIQIFAQARPPGIYKQDYINALFMLYHERKPEQLVCPSTPEWKRSSDLDLNGEAVQDEDDDGNTAPVSHEEEHIENEAMTNDDVLGDWIPLDQRDSLQQFCCHQLRVPPTGRGKLQFPGSHPVSLNRDNLQLLRQRYYYATWKADGTRYMMLITLHGCYLIDRKFEFRRVQLRFPLRSGTDGVHNYTLIDGEMIIDTLPTTGKLERRYLAYDLMVLNGESVVERPFSERWKLLEREVIDPRNIDRRQNPIYRYDLEPFRVRRKDFWLLSTVTKLLKEFIPILSHAADGLIFQGWDDPYVPRTHEGLLKWKYPEMNSVDFLFEVGSENRHLLFLNERGKKKLMDGARVTLKDVEDVSTLSGNIMECSWNSEDQSWVCMRIRTDKATPNEISTYTKVLRSIKDNITEEVLLNEIGEIVQLPMYSDRIAKAQQMQHSHSGQRRR
uniref:mRNA guanylyltransferase n=1 Tax=Anthurium amnicola TaxID=1678845 RepID=A0A1D1YR46_9ARAE